MGKTADGKPIGLDVAVVEHVAGILERPIEFHWCAARNAPGTVYRQGAVMW